MEGYRTVYLAWEVGGRRQDKADVNVLFDLARRQPGFCVPHKPCRQEGDEGDGRHHADDSPARLVRHEGIAVADSNITYTHA